MTGRHWIATLVLGAALALPQAGFAQEPSTKDKVDAKAQQTKEKTKKAGKKAAAKTGKTADKAAEKIDRTEDKADAKADKTAAKADGKMDKAGEKIKETAGTAGEAITDAWITTKIKADFVNEDTLEGSDINVDTNNHVVTLKGTVASLAGKSRAQQIARTTKGVTRVVNQLQLKAR